MRKGEVVFIPGGRIHAICEGALLFEVQQNSETTYRIYDWNRTDANGKQRDLHVEQALKAIYWQDSHDLKITARHLESDLRHQFVSLGACPFFAIDRFDVFNEWRISASPRTFQIFFCLEGEAKMHGEFETEDLKVGMTYLIPAGCSPVEIKGKCQILRIRLP
jgi:mannose-6-phosphate isomerase